MTYADRIAPRRTRNAVDTRARILALARAQFAAQGFERTTLRSIAADVGVDPAMIIRYFGSKDALFAEAAHLAVELPDLHGIAPDDLGDVLMTPFFSVWEDSDTFLALLRAAMTSPAAAERMRGVFASEVAPVLAAVTPDHPAERAGVLGAFIIGLAVSRYVLGTPGLSGMSRTELARWARPVIVQILTGPTPGDDGARGTDAVAR